MRRADDIRRLAGPHDFIAKLVCTAVLLFAVGGWTDRCPAAGVVASVHPLATDAGQRALQRGGNAVDAAVATALTLGVVDGHNSGLGGGCFILIRRPDGQLYAIDGREAAPLKAHRDMYVRDGRARGELSRTGPLAPGTPGALAAHALAVREHGRLSLAELLEPAAAIAAEGFPLDRIYARNLRATADELRRFPASKRAFLKPDGNPYEEGELLRQPDLAATYRAIAAQGTDWFYNGPFAKAVEEWMIGHGGILSADDFAQYEVKQRTPLQTKYRRYTIVGFPPPSSGGVHVAQILNILEHFDLASLNRRRPVEFRHVIAEAMKLAFADRAYWLGDADYAPVPRGLVDKTYAKSLAERIDRRTATQVDQHGTPPLADTKLFGDSQSRHTTHIAAADDEGTWVAITATVNTSFGSKVVIPNTGVVLNNEMDDFSIQPGVPNAFGLLGAEANAIEPLKRPLSSMSPTIVLEDGQPKLTLGAAGGPTIITQVVLGIVRHLDLGQPLQQAFAAPRFHHQWSPDRLVVEAGLSADLVAGLVQRGHRVTKRQHLGVSQGITRTAAGLFGVHDPRVPGKATSLEMVTQEK